MHKLYLWQGFPSEPDSFHLLLQATDNVSQNTIVEYIMINSIFEAVIQVIFRVFTSFIVMNTL